LYTVVIVQQINSNQKAYLPCCNQGFNQGVLSRRNDVLSYCLSDFFSLC